MILRIKPCRYVNHGRKHTYYEIQQLTFFGWETIYHNGGFIMFWNRTWAEEFVRLYNALQRTSKK